MRQISAALWLIPLLVISAMVAHNPVKRTVTPLYHEASANWWAGQDLYVGPSGMNYLPHFAVLFTPFQKLPVPGGDILWRAGAAALLAFGLWRLAKLQFGEHAPRAFLWATVLALPLTLPALRNGQANAMFAGLTLCAAAALAESCWWRATLWMALALAVKPLGIVLMLLAPVVYAPLRWRAALGLAALAVLPFLFARPDYVIAQHRGIVTNLQSCAAVTEHRFADINGVVRTFGGELPARVSKLVRVLAGGVTLALWWLGARRLNEPRRALWLLALTTAYLMLFNPMNEANSYVILAPALGLWAVAALESEPSRHAGWFLVFAALSMGCLPNLVRPVFGNNFALLWHPVMTAVFVGLLMGMLWRKNSELVPAPATS